MQIRAECHSDDRMVEAAFDAEPWFKQASDEDVVRLARCGWGNDYPADELAIFIADMNEEVQRVFTYLDLVAHKKNPPGFECTVEHSSAIEWLSRHNPELAMRVQKLRSDETADEDW